jgi:hypothetical protein
MGLRSEGAGAASTLTAEQALSYASELLAQRYVGAEFCIAAGTIIRGEIVTAHSDLDLVVLYPALTCAFRESFLYRSMPVEAFVHDHETIQAFMDRDHRNAHPAVIHMVASGTVVGGPTETSQRLQNYARVLFDDGPEETTDAQLKALRYSASELIEDLRDDRPPHEVRAILYRLYSTLAELRLRQSQCYVGTGKHLARALMARDPPFAETLDAVMITGHLRRLDVEQIEQLVGLLDTLGGQLFDGYQQDAPAEMRAKARWHEQA